ncbi:MAG: InlB B-repeat-containing protein [Clostridia bacterium]|nr:InlB B-repeat-containing protein [Clostridia bacterium]
MTTVKKLTAIVLAFLMLIGTVTVMASAWDVNTDDGSTVSITTKIVRQVNGKWVETRKVKEGEDVKALILLDSDFYQGGGQIAFFYTKDFFSTPYTMEEDIEPGEYYADLIDYASIKPLADSAKNSMINRGMVPADFFSTYDTLFIQWENGEAGNYMLQDSKTNGDDIVAFEVDLTVKTGLSADARGDFFTTTGIVRSSANTRGYTDITKGQQGASSITAESMVAYDATVVPSSQDVGLFTNPVTATFMANGGIFSDEETNKVFEGDVGEALTVEDPTREGYTFQGWIAQSESEASAVTAYPSVNTVYTADWLNNAENTEGTLTFHTEFVRLDPDSGEWIETERVAPGDDVKVRLYIDTDYTTSSGQVLLFAENSFFEDNFTLNRKTDVTANPDAVAAGTNPTAAVTKVDPSGNNTVIKRIKNYGTITDETLAANNVYLVTFEFANSVVSEIDGDEWFIEFPLKVRDDAATADTDKLGVSYVDLEGVFTPDNPRGAYTNIALAEQDGDLVSTTGLWLVYMDLDSDNTPVSLESTITFDANEGTFPGDETTVSSTGIIGTAVDPSIEPEPTRDGFTFKGWMDGEGNAVEFPDDVSVYPYDDITLYAVWISEVELTFVYDNGMDNEVKTVTYGDPFENPTEPNPTKDGYIFYGWTTDATLGEITGLPETNPGVSTTYYAVYEPATYVASYYVLNPDTLTFERIHTARVPYGDPIPTEVPANVIPEGHSLSEAYKEYTFTTVYTSDDTMPASDISLFYRISANTYNAIFDAAEGKFSDETTEKTVPTVFGEVIEKPEDPTREGYVFTGWDPEPDIMDEAADTYFVATWEGNHHTLTYLNEDDSEYEVFDVANGDPKDVPADPYKEGYAFLGWVPSTAEYDAANAIDPDTLAAETMPDEDLIYKAIFEVEQYNASFYMKGEIDDTTDPVTYTVDDADLILTEQVNFGDAIPEPEETPVMEGYTFMGWQPAVPESMPAEDQIFIAQWEINTHNVKYIANGETILDQDVDYGDPVPVADVPPLEGYSFNEEWGWSPEKVDYMPDEDLVFYAVYTVNSYDLTWDANTGAWADDSTVIGPTETEYGTVLTLPEDPEKEGYVFVGWAETADAEPEDVMLPYTMPAADTTYYAVWVPGEVAYTVEYYLMDVEGNYADPTPYTYDKTGTTGTTATADIATPDGYHTDVDNPDYLAEDVIAADGSTVLKVFYARNEYNVTFDANGGELALPEDASATYLYGQTLLEPEDPTREGYTFAGWDPDLVRVVTADADYTAQWTVNQYDIIYISEGEEIDRDSFDYQAVPTDYDGETPTKEGYSFTGWDTELPETMPAENVTRTALFEINDYDVIFDANGGKYLDDSTQKIVPMTYDDEITAPDEDPTMEGYAFIGWAETEDAEEPLVTLGYVPEGGITFYAVYEPDYVDYTVEYYYEDLDGNYVLNPDPAQVISNVKKTGETAEVLPAEVEGYQLNEGESVLSAEVLADGSTILVVKYDLITYNLTVDLDNGTEPTVTPYRYGETITQPEEPTEADKPGFAFSGWAVVGGEFDDEIPAEMPANDVGVTALWDRQFYTLTFLVDGEPYAGTPTDVPYEDPIVAPTNPTKQGYDFQGWALQEASDAIVDIEETMPNHDLTYVAVFEPAEQDYILSIYVMGTDGTYPADATEVKDYTGHTMDTVDVTADAQAAIEEGFHEDTTQTNVTTATLLPNGLSNPLVFYIARDEHTLTVKNEDGTETVSETPYLYGADVTEPTAPEKEGYSFAGWVDEDDNPVDIPETMGLEDITVKPTYAPIPYNAVFDANGGRFYDNSTQQVISVDYDAAITAPAVNPTWTGYDFQGWAATDDADEPLADLGTMDSTDGKIFYAVWTPAEYTVTYYVKNPTTGDFEQKDQQTVAFGEEIPAIDYTAPEGYTLSDPYKNVTMTSPLTADDTMPASDLDLYYKLIPNEYTATFYEENGTTVIGEPATVAYGDAIPTPAAPAVEGKTFAGWNPEVPATMPAENQSFVATYTQNDYTVTYLVDGTTLETQTYHYTDAITAATAPTKEGYTFDGWYDGSNNALPAQMPANDLIVSAKYSVNTHALKFIVDDVAVVDEDAVAYGTALSTYKPADPTKEGYTFAGWGAEVPATMPDNDLTFTATWTKNSYNAIYIADGATVRTDSVAYGDPLPAAPEAPAKDGYNFTGWTPDSPDSMPAEDLTFTAVYEANEYTLIFIHNNDANDVTEITPIYYNDAINAPAPGEKVGYVFTGWTLQGTEEAMPATMPASDLTLEGNWEPGTVAYTVESYLMDLEGNYPDDPFQTIEQTGTTGEPADATATAATITGFHLDDAHAAEAAVDAIAADGSTVLKLYYARDEINVTFYGNGGLIIGSGTTKEETYLYGQTVTPPADDDLYLDGYTFTGWDPAVVLVALEDAEYFAQWEIQQRSVTFIVDGEVFDVESGDYGFELTVPDAPVKDGYEFDDWYLDGVQWIPPTNVTEDATVEAHYNAIPYNATFYLELDAEEDDYFDQYEVPFDEAIPAPDGTPVKTGYELAGWSTDGETPLADLGTMDSTAGKVFYAVWAPVDVDYTVEHYYQLADGTYPTTAEPIETLQAPSDSEVTATPIDRDYFTVDADHPDANMTDTVDPEGNTVLKVFYARKSSTVTIDKNDGSDDPITTIEGLYEAPIDPAIEQPTRDGYEFAGWVDGEGNPVEVVPTAIPGEDLTLIAQWDALPFTLKYINEEEEVVNETVNCGEPILSYTPGNPIRDGYSFVGWFTEDDKQPADYPNMPASDLTFTAVWAATANRLYILEVYEMDTTGNYPTDPTSTFTFNNGVVGQTVSPSIEVPTGFTLDTAHEDSLLSGEIPASEDETLVLKAFFARDQYTLTTVVKGESTDTPYYYNQAVSVDDPVVEGETFLGWFDAAEGGNPVEIPANMPAEDITVYAQFESILYTATFDAGDGKFEDTNEAIYEHDYYFSDTIEKPADPKREGYRFDGWEGYTDSMTMPAEDITFTAIWTKTESTATFYSYVDSEHGPAATGDLYEVGSDTKLFGENITFPEGDPSDGMAWQENYYFMGWSTEENGAIVDINDQQMPAEDIAYYAVFERVKVMLIPKTEDATTVIDRNGLTVDDYDPATSYWYVYGLEEMIDEDLLREQYCDVSGDGYFTVTRVNNRYAPWTGTGTVIDVYDAVTGRLVESFWIIIYGDLDGNAYIDTDDSLMLRNEMSGTTYWFYDDEEEYCHYRAKAADINKDGALSANDANAIRNNYTYTSINQVDPTLS